MIENSSIWVVSDVDGTLMDHSYDLTPAKGSIQIPKDGNPIILMSDSQSTGGYPIFGNICKIDISKLSQVKPNQKIKFKFISLKESNKLIKYEKEKFKSKLNLDLSS